SIRCDHRFVRPSNHLRAHRWVTSPQGSLTQVGADYILDSSPMHLREARPMNPTIVNRLLLLLFVPVVFAAPAALSVGDWPDWRGPKRDGVSREKNLPEKWSLSGQNLSWKASYGGRSAPVILGDHLYLQNTAGKGETEQERVMCFNADTGKLLWEHR